MWRASRPEPDVLRSCTRATRQTYASTLPKCIFYALDCPPSSRGLTMRHLLLPLFAILMMLAGIDATPAGDKDAGWTKIFNGKDLDGWHTSAATGHSRTSKNKSAGRWVVEDGAIVGSQDVPGNGGIVI